MTSGDFTGELRLALPRDLGSATKARHATAEAVSEWGMKDLAEVAATVVTELVTNAVLHAQPEIELRIRRGRDCVRVEVTDGSPNASVVLPTDDPAGDPTELTMTTGRGLRLVDGLSARWGWAPGGTDKTVWADVGAGEPDPAWERSAGTRPRPALDPSPGRASDGHRRRVKVIGIPVRLAIESEDHLNELIRELQLVTLGGAARELPESFAETVAAMLERYDESRRATRRLVHMAADAGLERIDAELDVHARAVTDLQRLTEQLDQLNEWGRRGHLLAPLASAELAAFRHWYANELSRQLAGRPPSPCPFDVRPGPTWQDDRGVAEVRLREARFRSLVEAAELDVWRADSEGALVTTMPEWQHHTGQAGDELLGDGWVLGIHPDHRERVLATWRRAVATGSVYQCEYPIVAPDGSTRQIVARAAPVREGGRVREWVGTTIDITDQRAAEREMAEQARLVTTLHDIGLALVSTLDQEQLLSRLTQSTTELTGADFGAFFFNAESADGEEYVLYTLHGAPRSAFENFPMPRNTKIFAPTFAGERTVRHDDVTAAPEYGQNPPRRGMPPGHLPVRSYLAVPVVSREGRVHGGLFFGHAERGRFTEAHETMVEAVARQAAVAIDNAMLYERQRATAGVLQRSLLPQEHPKVAGLDYAVRYLPGGSGAEVGGDWYEVSADVEGDAVLAIGDVQGRGVQAAGFMGQMRAAVRAYALAGLDPVETLELLDRFWTHQPDILTTCLYMRFDTVGGKLEVASAGHLPPMLVQGEVATHLALDAGPPLGVGMAGYRATTVRLAEGDGFVLFTDGLVERRERPIGDGIECLRDLIARNVTGGAWSPDGLADALVSTLAGDDLADDVAVVVGRRTKLLR